MSAKISKPLGGYEVSKEVAAMLDNAKSISLELEKDLDSVNLMMYSAEISHNLMLDLLDLA